MRLRGPLLTALITTCALAASAAPAGAATDQLTIFDAGRELTGEFGESTRQATLDELDALGVDVVRIFVYWRRVAPSPDAATIPPGFDPRDHLDYGVGGANWSQTDQLVLGAQSRGMQVVLVPTSQPPTGRVPLWASLDQADSQSHPDAGAFEDFLFALGSRYGDGPGSIADAELISVLNEPNNARWLQARDAKGKAFVPKLYRSLVVAARRGLNDAGWGGKLLIGETGPNPPGKLLDPIPFMRKVLCINQAGDSACPMLDVDGWAHHPYSLRMPPFEKPFDPAQITISNLGRMIKQIKLAENAGALPAQTPLYVTEYGYQTLPDPLFGVPRKLQAAYLSISEKILWKNPRVASYAQYLMRDDPPQGNSFPGFESGLRTFDSPNQDCQIAGSGCKPAYRAFRTPLAVSLKGRGKCVRREPKPGRLCLKRAPAPKVRVWGHVRPATSSEQVTIRVHDRGRRDRSVKLQTDDDGYFSIVLKNRAARRWSLRWSSFKGPRVRAYAF